MGLGVQGFSIGHWSDADALTGCTVVLCPQKTVGSCDIRGSSPAVRETALLAPDKTMQEVHAVLLTGGSAFGLAAADGVMRYLSERNVGYETPWVKVPIVPAAAIFDLNVGDGSIRPTSSSGYHACRSAAELNSAQGNVGAGMGATVGKWAGPEARMKGGLGLAHVERGELCVGSVAVVNSIGDVIGTDGRVIAGARDLKGGYLADTTPVRLLSLRRNEDVSNTTLVCVTTNARLSKVDVNRVAQRAHDGMARAIIPAHTSFDGDVVFVLASGIVEEQFDIVAELAAEAVSQSIRHAVLYARTAGGIPGLAGV
jgi:L-aminopeptidase/D-esterase-like protein